MQKAASRANCLAFVDVGQFEVWVAMTVWLPSCFALGASSRETGYSEFSLFPTYWGIQGVPCV